MILTRDPIAAVSWPAALPILQHTVDAIAQLEAVRKGSIWTSEAPQSIARCRIMLPGDGGRLACEIAQRSTSSSRAGSSGRQLLDDALHARLAGAGLRSIAASCPRQAYRRVTPREQASSMAATV